VAFAGAVALYAAGKKWMRIGLVYACCMGFCRMYLMMHYPTDVLFGALCGALCGVAALYVCKWAEAAWLQRQK
jgi:undecaprenyl-diphosphatase